MKSTGIVRKIDPLGRIVIPRELFKTLGLSFSTEMEFSVDGNKIVLQKYTPYPLTPTQQALETLQNQHFKDSRIQSKLTELATLINGGGNG